MSKLYALDSSSWHLAAHRSTKNAVEYSWSPVQVTSVKYIYIQNFSPDRKTFGFYKFTFSE